MIREVRQKAKPAPSAIPVVMRIAFPKIPAIIESSWIFGAALSGI
jgi:hypothetical protein